MSETHSTTNEPAPLMNDIAARSPTGEILDVRGEPKPATTETTTTDTSKPQTLDGTTSVTEPAKTEPKAGETLLTDKKEGETKTADAPKVPDKYEFKLPEGVALAPETVEAITPVLKELGLSNEQAQKLMDFHAAELAKVAKAPETAIETQRQKWVTETLADPEIKAYSLDGKQGIDAVKIDIGRAKSVMSPAVRDAFDTAMNTTGIGNNPAFVKALWQMAQHITEGKHVAGGNPSRFGQTAPGQGDRPTAAKAMYPNNP